jgi:hypothetical protein
LNQMLEKYQLGDASAGRGKGSSRANVGLEAAA